MGELVVKKQNDLLANEDKSLLSYEFTVIHSKNRNRTVNNFSEILKSILNLNDIINPKKEYVVKFSKDVLRKISSGLYDVRKDKNGELLAEIIDTTLPKNRNLVHILRMDEINPNLKEDVKNLGSNVTNLAVQQQLAELSEMLIQIQNTIIDIKRGQMTDRLGLILSGKSQLEQALQLDDSNSNKRNLINGAIKSINDGKSQLELAIIDEINKKTFLPDNKFKILVSYLIHSNSFSDVENQYYAIQEGMYAYFEATRLLVQSYTVIDCKEVIPTILEQTAKLIEKSHEKMVKMEGIAIGGTVSEDYWYDNPQLLIDEISKSYQVENIEDEYITLEVSGWELLKEENDE